MTGRIPCINPACRRTAAQDKFPDSDEIICGKCFRALPAAMRAEHRRIWREIRRWERRIVRTSDEMRIAKMNGVVERFTFLLGRHWDREIKSAFLAPTKPEGLDAFLEEVGL